MLIFFFVMLKVKFGFFSTLFYVHFVCKHFYQGFQYMRGAVVCFQTLVNAQAANAGEVGAPL